jgi:hypothetical protein
VQVTYYGRDPAARASAVTNVTASENKIAELEQVRAGVYALCMVHLVCLPHIRCTRAQRVTSLTARLTELRNPGECASCDVLMSAMRTPKRCCFVRNVCCNVMSLSCRLHLPPQAERDQARQRAQAAHRCARAARVCVFARAISPQYHVGLEKLVGYYADDADGKADAISKVRRRGRCRDVGCFSGVLKVCARRCSAARARWRRASDAWRHCARSCRCVLVLCVCV